MISLSSPHAWRVRTCDTHPNLPWPIIGGNGDKRVPPSLLSKAHRIHCVEGLTR
jgi:hypothetical protein